MLKRSSTHQWLAIILAAILFIVYLWQSKLSNAPYMFCDEELYWAVARDINKGIYRTAWNFIYSGSGLAYRIINPIFTELRSSGEGVYADNFNRIPFYFINIFCTYILLSLSTYKIIVSKFKAAIYPAIFFISPYLLANMFYVYQDQGSLFFSAAYLYFSITYWQNRKLKYLVLSGLFGGLLAACKPPYAILILLIIFIVFIKYFLDKNKNYKYLISSLSIISLFLIIGLIISSPEYILQPKFMYDGLVYNSKSLYKASLSNIPLSLFTYFILTLAAFGPLFLLILAALKNNLRSLSLPILLTLACYILTLSFGSLVLFRNLIVLTPFAFMLFMILIKSHKKGENIFLYNNILLIPFSIIMIFNSFYSQNTRLLANEYLSSLTKLNNLKIEDVYFSKPCMGEKNPAEVVFKDNINLHPLMNNSDPNLLNEKTLVVSDSWADGHKKSLFMILDWRDIHFEIFNLRDAFISSDSMKAVNEKYLIHSIDYGAGPKYRFYYIRKE